MIPVVNRVPLFNYNFHGYGSIIHWALVQSAHGLSSGNQDLFKYQIETKFVKLSISIYNGKKVCSFRRILLILVLALPSISLAQRSGGISYGIMAMFGSGQMGNGDIDNLAPKRTMEYFPIGAFFGYNFKSLRLGLNYEYVIVNQTTSPSEVNFTNLSGKESNAGLRVEYYNGKYSFGAIIKPVNDYKLTKTTGDGNSSAYKAKLGFGLQATAQLRKEIGLVVDFSSTTYDESLSDANVVSNRFSLGLILSNFKGGR